MALPALKLSLPLGPLRPRPRPNTRPTHRPPAGPLRPARGSGAVFALTAIVLLGCCATKADPIERPALQEMVWRQTVAVFDILFDSESAPRAELEAFRANHQSASALATIAGAWANEPTLSASVNLLDDVFGPLERDGNWSHAVEGLPPAEIERAEVAGFWEGLDRYLRGDF